MKTNIIITVIAFFLMGSLMYFFNLYKLNQISKKKKKKGKDYEIIEFKYLTLTYNLVPEKLYNKTMVLIISIINAFIIAVVFFVVIIIPWKVLWQLLLGFVFLLGFIYAFYGILGKILVMKGYDKK